MLSKVAILAVALSGVVPHVLAHGGVMSYSWGGSWYNGWLPYTSPTNQTTIERPWLTANPITNATDPTIACNDDGTAGALQLTATAAAGTAITAYWSSVWPHSIGPMTTYMANCEGDCTPVNASTLKWFKIDQAGLLSGTVGNGSWADGKMIAQNSSWTSTIPSCIPAGNYMIRFETIAIHVMPAQFYLECAQITITGGGRTVPHNTVTFPGGYSNTDPGLIVDIYSVTAETQTNYTIPGPPLFTCGSTTTTTTTTKSATSTTVTKSTTTISSSKSTPTTTTTISTSKSTPTPTTTTTAIAVTQTHYGQCGGQSWTGPTICASPYTCQASSTYYSQCL